MQLGKHISVWLKGMASPFHGTLATVTNDSYVILKSAGYKFTLAGSEVVATSTAES